MLNTISIHQPNYIPWLGYFHKMANCEIFVFLDNVKHSKSSFTHRNYIKNNDQAFLLSLPLKNKESPINELILHDPELNLKKHYRQLENSYKKGKYWKVFELALQTIYHKKFDRLFDLNLELIKMVNDFLEINPKLILASEIDDLTGDGNERNLNICKKLNADIYLSGSGARSYNDEASFNLAGIKLMYNEFKHPIYQQIGNNFVSNLSILDVIINNGKDTIYLLQNQ